MSTLIVLILIVRGSGIALFQISRRNSTGSWPKIVKSWLRVDIVVKLIEEEVIDAPWL